jgi:UDP-glucose 4-epimerase
MRIVVTGGAGFVGKHLLDRLVGEGHELLAIDDFSVGRPEHLPVGVCLRQLDLTSVTAADLALELSQFDAEAVVHLAAMHFIPDCMARPERTFAVNTQSTHTLVQALERHPVGSLVLASTMDVYGTEDRVHDEADPPGPCNVYGLSKSLSERLLAYAVERGACRSAVALRLANVYGPNETNPHLIPDTLERVVHPDGPELVMGYLGAARDFVFVGDVARAFVMAVTFAADGFSVFNVGTGRPMPVRRVVQMLQELFGDRRPIRENAAAFRKFDRVSLTPRVEAIERALGWRAETPFARGLQETVATLCTRPLAQAV